MENETYLFQKRMLQNPKLEPPKLPHTHTKSITSQESTLKKFPLDFQSPLAWPFPEFLRDVNLTSASLLLEIKTIASLRPLGHHTPICIAFMQSELKPIVTL